jgi:phosphatidate cytidylyltransferase
MADSLPPKDKSKFKNLRIRAGSAFVALVVLSVSVYFYNIEALRVLTMGAVLLGTRELVRILFLPEESLLIKCVFAFMVLFVFALTAWSLSYSSLAFSLVSILFFSCGLWFEQRFRSVTALSVFQAKGTLGFLYMGLLPGFTMNITYLNNGFGWFLGMLGFVFAGDTMAYLSGMLLGRTPLLPAISPKKTVEGALGGLCGSVLAGFVLLHFYPQFPMWPVLTLAALTGLAGQMGDLFESLLKRVANKKDSGRLMPGHGGVLDRIDGVLFASPVMLAGAMLIEFSLAAA